MKASSTALLIIDMQNDGMTMIPMFRQVIPAIARVLETCRSQQIQVIYKSRVHRADGVDVETFRRELFARKPFLVENTPGAAVVDELCPAAGDIMVRGTRFSGFFQTDLQLILTRLGVRRLLICGVQTPNCIRATVTDAIAYDYEVVLVTDAVMAQSPEIHAANLFDMKHMGVTMRSMDELIAELQNGAE